MKLLIGAVLMASTALCQQQPQGTPLLSARLSLQLAKSPILEQRNAEAATALRSVAQALADYERLSPGPRDGEAEYIRGQLLDYAARPNWNESEMLDRIDYLRFSPVNDWYQRITE